MLKRFVVPIGAVAAALAPAPALSAQVTADQARRADSLFAEFTVAGSPGASVAVVRDGKVIFTKGYGLANLEHQVPVTPSTVFDVASVSKQFTGLAVAMLIQQGKVSLTDDIRKYIPELQVMQPPITVEHLLHHESGMRDWPGMLNVSGWRYDDVISFDQILSFAYHQKTLNFVPGAEYTYSNTGYNLLAEMVQRVTGKSFRAWTDENLFKPLGMTSTVFRDDYTLVVPRRALGYSRGPNGTWRAATNNLTALGSSSLMSSAEDMAKWLMNFDDARVGGDAARTLARTRGKLNSGADNPYAFGISHGSYRGVPMLNHSGSWASFVSYLLQFPQQKTGIVVLANTPSVNTARAAYTLADIFLGDALGAPAPPAPPPPLPTTRFAVDKSVLDRYVGVYRAGPAMYVRISRRDSVLVAQTPGAQPQTLTARSANEFCAQNCGTVAAFDASASGPVTSLTLGGRKAERVDDNALMRPSNMSVYAGTYESDELGIAYPIEVRDSTLVLRSRQLGDIVLTHRGRDEFNGTGSFRTLEFERDGARRVTGFVLNIDERSRNIRFVKR